MTASPAPDTGGAVIYAFIERPLETADAAARLAERGVVVCPTWSSFRNRDLQSADGAVCAIAALDGRIWNELVCLIGNHPALSVVLVTGYTRENVRAIASVLLHEVLFLDQVTESDLVAAVAAIGRRNLLQAAAVSVRRRHLALHPELAETLARACTAARPPHTVSDLAALMGYCRSTFLRRWRASLGRAPSPHRFIEWLVLVHALHHRARTGASWARVAERLDVKEQTLREGARRLFRMTLTQLERADSARLIAGFDNALCGSLPASPTSLAPERDDLHH